MAGAAIARHAHRYQIDTIDYLGLVAESDGVGVIAAPGKRFCVSSYPAVRDISRIGDCNDARTDPPDCFVSVLGARWLEVIHLVVVSTVA